MPCRMRASPMCRRPAPLPSPASPMQAGLGLWAAGETPFETRTEFVSAMEAGGVAAMEGGGARPQGARALS